MIMMMMMSTRGDDGDLISSSGLLIFTLLILFSRVRIHASAPNPLFPELLKLLKFKCHEFFEKNKKECTFTIKNKTIEERDRKINRKMIFKMIFFSI